MELRITWDMNKEDKDMNIDFFLDYMTIERGCSSNTIKGYSHDERILDK
jgi:site-specific recombinase XerD